jgi:predicted dinucleotide-binding enzyme
MDTARTVHHLLHRTHSAQEQVMPIGIIGAGAIGRPLAQRLAAAGEQVLVSNSRGPETLRDWAARAGGGIRPVSVKEAAAGEIIVLAVPWRHLQDAVASTGVTDWSGRIVIDTTNPLGPPDFEVADLGGLTSSEAVAGLVPGARLVKAFNTLPRTSWVPIPAPRPGSA